jgi:hypothetical protein
LDVSLDSRVTVLLGANDHGKSNLLDAIRHLNSDDAFEDDDLNWDSGSEELPRIDYWLQLDEDDRLRLLEIANERVASPPSDSGLDEDLVETPDSPPSDPAAGEADRSPPTVPALSLEDIPSEIRASRVGVSEGRTNETPKGLPKGAARQLLSERLPTVELIQPFDRPPDQVTRAELETEPFEFMVGIFHYAGIREDEWDDIFIQNPKTARRLEDASEVLNATLRESWGQGADLVFSLAHHSAAGAIELRIKDPSVGGRFVHVSQKSSGFTHFFSLKTVLQARQRAADSGRYIWLFDEPGIYLHPAGQRDLQQALEAVAESNQVVYSTHSVFLVNKNFPARHRLVHKGRDGTVIDSKPYTSRWHSALESLGLSLPGSILFASHVLITEGDSEPLLLYPLLRKMIAAGASEADLNPLAVIGSGDARNADVLIRLLSEAEPRPRIAVLLDGDRGGSDRLRVLKRSLDNKSIPWRQLTKDTTVEDHLPHLREAFVPAVSRYIAAVREDQGLAEIANLDKKLASSFDTRFPKPNLTVGVAEWARSEAVSTGGLASEPSSVGIAREYGLILDEDPSLAGFNKRPADLLRWVFGSLELPNRAAVEETILDVGEDD